MRTPPHRCPVPHATYPPALAPKRPDGHPRRDAVEANARTDPAGKEPAGSDSPRGRTTRSNQGPGAPARVDSHALSAHRLGRWPDGRSISERHQPVLERKHASRHETRPAAVGARTCKSSSQASRRASGGQAATTRPTMVGSAASTLAARLAPMPASSDVQASVPAARPARRRTSNDMEAATTSPSTDTGRSHARQPSPASSARARWWSYDAMAATSATASTARVVMSWTSGATGVGATSGSRRSDAVRRSGCGRLRSVPWGAGSAPRPMSASIGSRSGCAGAGSRDAAQPRTPLSWPGVVAGRSRSLGPCCPERSTQRERWPPGSRTRGAAGPPTSCSSSISPSRSWRRCRQTHSRRRSPGGGYRCGRGYAVCDLRDHGKFAVAWAETFGEFGNGSVAYLLATSFEEVWLQPSGDVGFTGVAVEVPFLRGALDKAGITPQLARRHEYKSAANTFTEREFTAAHREATERVVASVTEQLVAMVAANRNLDPDHVRGLMDGAPLFAREALEAGLVDRLGYRDDVYDAVRARAGADVVLQYLGRYRRSRLAQLSARVATAPPETVAMVHVTGPIHLGRSRHRPLAGTSAGADTVTAALRAASKADDGEAIVLRVGSPGRAYVASDAIWRQVAATRRAGKPVVVSMGDVAASGGYFVSMGADTILAEPGTMTGSIGVVSGKPVVDGLVDRVGVGHEGVAGGRHGLMFSPLRAFTEEEWERLNVWLDRIYDDFTAKVAEGRGLSPDRVHEIARGRVWTGADAKERGLVDELGGLGTALDLARERAGLPPSGELEARVYPRLPLAARLRPAQSSED